MFQLESLPRKFPRQFCPPDLEASEIEALRPLFESLKKREVESAEDLEEWLLDLNEFLGIIHETGSVLFIRTACHTDREDYEEDYNRYLDEVQSELSQAIDELNRVYLKHREKIDLPEDRYFLFHRSLAKEAELFRKENVPLQIKATKLGQKYSKLRGQLTVEWEGEEKTLSQMNPLVQNPDRKTREKAWRLVTSRRLEERETFDEIFDELFKIRIEIAKNAGFDNYLEYRFQEMGRFDYNADDCRRLHRAVQKVIVPKIKEFDERRRQALGVETLRPWDLDASPYGELPQPFETGQEMIEKCQKIFDRLDHDFAEISRLMDELDLLDVDNRKNKMPGGFQSALQESRLPFIFMNAVGVFGDLRTMLHEFGHAFNYFLARQDPLVTYRHPPIEFAEVASMSMELLGLPHWDVFYSPEDLKRAQLSYFSAITRKILWFSTIDSFQLELYSVNETNPSHRKEIWEKVMDRFSGGEDWSGLEDERAYLWQKQIHLFRYPFYYVEYLLARLGSLQVWLRSLDDADRALADYKRALKKGGTLDLPGLYEEAGIELIFEEDKLREVMDQVMEKVFALEKEVRGDLR